MNRFGKWKIFSLSPTLSAQPISAFFFFTPQPSNFFPAGPLPAPGPIRPSAPSPSLFHRQAGPARRDRLPLGSEPDSSLKPTEIPARAPPSPSWARTPRSVLRPYKRNPRPLKTPNRSRSRRLRENLASAPPPLLELGVLRDAAVPTRPCRLQALQEFRTEVVRLIGLFFFSFSLRFVRFSSPAP